MTWSERQPADAHDAAPLESVERWRLVRDAVAGALELPPSARRAFLDDACGPDTAARAAAAEWVDACERADGSPSFLAESAAARAGPLLASGGLADDTGLAPAADLAAFAVTLASTYVIEREIGRGGMATVYRAHDRKHDRPVALKLLDPELGAALGPERFLAEIAVTARLRHPNLLPLFDSGEANGRLYYVMPLVEGESLRARLGRERQLPVDEALRIAIAVAGALDHAHRQGVVHRDLKPENILLQDGIPVVADFGIALALSIAGGARLTRRGISIGTPQYMSPEQAAADRPVDARSDVYALGCTLYEMLTGEPPHTGTSVQTVMTRVLTEAPRPVRVLRPSVPVALEEVLDRALAKLPADRYGSARAFADALAAADVGGNAGVARTGRPGAQLAIGGRRRVVGAVLLATVAAVGGAGATWLWTRPDRDPPPAAARFIVEWTPAAFTGRGAAPVVMPDGRSLVYVGDPALGRPLLVRRLDELTARPLAGTEGAVRAFTSPDGRSLAFVTGDDRLKTVALDGGAPTVLAGTFRYTDVSWGAGDVIVTDSYGVDGLSWLPAGGGALRPLTRYDAARGESRHSAPLVLADGSAVIFTAERQRSGPGPSLGELAIAPLAGRTSGLVAHSPLGVKARQAVAVVDGWLVYVGPAGDELLAVRLDAAHRRTIGAPVPVLQNTGGRIDAASLASDGTLVYTRDTDADVPVVVDAAGTARPLLGGPGGSYMNPRLSPDGRRVAVHAVSPQGTDIWIYDLASHTPTRLTTTGTALLPTWTPDGQRILFVSAASTPSLWWQRADGSAPAERLFDATGLFAFDVAPDGRTVVFQRQVGGAWGLWTAALDGDHRPRPLLREQSDVYMPAISPDGRWLAYVSNASGRFEVYARPFAGAGAAVQVSDSGGTEPAWSRDGQRLFYRAADRLVAATVSTEQGLAITARTPRFADTFQSDMPHTNYAVAPDGAHFLMVERRGTAVPETVVVLHWLTELRARLAAAR